MTAHEIETLKEWMREKFDDRDKASAVFAERLDKMENTMQRVESTQVGQTRQLSEVLDVVEDLRDIRDGIQQFTRVVLSKRTWSMLAGAIVVGNWVADHLPMFVGWFS